MAVVNSQRHARRLLLSAIPGAVSALALLLSPATTQAQAPTYDCSSKDPARWPPATKPYFMLLVDTSGSMISCTNPSGSSYDYPDSCPSTSTRNSCGLEPTRLNDAKCALRQTVQAFSGQVNFGMATFGVRLSGCDNGTVPDSCASGPNVGGYNGDCNPPNALATEGEFYEANDCTVAGYSDPDPTPNSTPTCGNRPDCAGTAPAAPNLAENFRNGGNIVVPLLQDATWAATQPATNVPELLKWFDGRTDESKELFALGNTPLEGILRTAQQYIAAGWNPAWDDGSYCASGLTYTYPTPLTAQDRGCRSVNFILVTDGDETCSGTATNAASQLFNTGVTIGANNFRVRTHVIQFAGGSQSATDAIAAAGGTTRSLFAANESQLSLQLSNIISSAIRPEVCNNEDDNCNGCVDEGYARYCNRRPTCCAWSTPAQRNTCLTNYTNSITSGDTDGNLDLLPCTSVAQQTQPANWLCYDPGEVCDDVDTNCNATVDEGVTKCGNPLACPRGEICNGQDDDCDNIVDNAPGNGIPYSLPGCARCNPSAEICDGCDNDCDGVVDDNIPAGACGFTPPANCAGQRTCAAAPGTVAAGACLPGYPRSRWSECSNNPAAEVCDSVDNDCDGTVDDGIAPTACDIPGQPNLYYKDSGPRQFAQSQCVRGQRPCNGTCSGWVGPSAEVCDGIDNDCDGVVDDNVPGVGVECGNATGRCTRGRTACVGGVLVCTGGSAPQPEVCNGIDDDCDGTTDDSPTDAPTNTGCWQSPAGTCTPACSHQNLQWCPPAGATCTSTGTLGTPCRAGTLVCAGTNRWQCQGGILPRTEVCDGIDNDCDRSIDDNLGPPVGTPCGGNGVCGSGQQTCNGGRIECVGQGTPSDEICDGKDNDCDGVVDEGQNGGQCWVVDPRFGTEPRQLGDCRPGRLACNAEAGSACDGVGPSPEICDGRDNDCDGAIDEPGDPPDGVDGTADPRDPTRIIGTACGTDEGACQKGRYVCENALVVCQGGVPPSTEVCDCADNDCDGVVDNQNDSDAGEALLCQPGFTCVQATANNCQCAPPCRTGEFPCTGGATCRSVTVSGQQTQLNACIVDRCGDCSTKTVTQGTSVACAPTGDVPQCVCKDNVCKSPCEGRECAAGSGCVPKGPAAGECQPRTNCNFFDCRPGSYCSNSVCVNDPCANNPCAAGEVCKPSETVGEHRCVPSCANVTCQAGQRCVDGECESTGCSQGCPTGQYCQETPDAGSSCAPSQCPAGPLPCSNGQYCDPVTGRCGNHPCAGVKCPTGQSCTNGECYWIPEGGAGTGGSGGSGGNDAGTSGGTTGNDASAGSGGSGNAGPGNNPRGVWGLATGGGGCSCRTAPARGFLSQAGALLAVAASVLALRRRRRRSRTTACTANEGGR
jgi:hypothetical protein